MTYADNEMRGATLFAKLMDKLREGGTYEELCDYTGLSYHTVQRYLKALHGLGTPLVRIADWIEDRTGRRSIPFWQLTVDGQKDAPRPKRTKAEKAQQKRNWRLSKLRSPSVFDQPAIRAAAQKEHDEANAG